MIPTLFHHSFYPIAESVLWWIFLSPYHSGAPEPKP